MAFGVLGGFGTPTSEWRPTSLRRLAWDVAAAAAPPAGVALFRCQQRRDRVAAAVHQVDRRLDLALGLEGAPYVDTGAVVGLTRVPDVERIGANRGYRRLGTAELILRRDRDMRLVVPDVRREAGDGVSPVGGHQRRGQRPRAGDERASQGRGGDERPSDGS